MLADWPSFEDLRYPPKFDAATISWRDKFNMSVYIEIERIWQFCQPSSVHARGLVCLLAEVCSVSLLATAGHAPSNLHQRSSFEPETGIDALRSNATIANVGIIRSGIWTFFPSISQVESDRLPMPYDHEVSSTH